MTLKIAIQPDEVLHRNGERQSYSDRWFALARAMDVEAVAVDVFSTDVIKDISTCDAFMWRCDPSAYMRLYSSRLMYGIEEGAGMPVFPNLETRWHFEDKTAQYYFLAASGIPTPATTVSWTREQAVRFCASATYPFVLKLATGYQGSNVRLIQNIDDALFYVDEMFSHGATSLGYRPASWPRRQLRRLRAALELMRGENPYGPSPEADLQYGYFLAQEFLPANDFDVRVTIIGNRAFAFRRFNRPGDFRASGSGRIDWEPSQIGEDALRLAYRVSRQMNAQTVAVDILRRNGEPVIVELTLAYASWAVRNCPGHWVLRGEPASGPLEWVAGSLEPADAIFTDFVAQVRGALGTKGMSRTARGCAA